MTSKYMDIIDRINMLQIEAQEALKAAQELNNALEGVELTEEEQAYYFQVMGV